MTEDFVVQNSDWKISGNTTDGFTLESKDGQQSIGPLPAAKMTSIFAVVDQLDVWLKSQ